MVALNSPPERSKWPKIVCNCVAWSKWYLGRENETCGYPKDMTGLNQEPLIGGIVVTNEGELGHDAVIYNQTGSILFLIEANFIPCEVSTRSFDIDSNVILGYY